MHAKKKSFVEQYYLSIFLLRKYLYQPKSWMCNMKTITPINFQTTNSFRLFHLWSKDWLRIWIDVVIDALPDIVLIIDILASNFVLIRICMPSMQNSVINNTWHEERIKGEQNYTLCGTRERILKNNQTTKQLNNYIANRKQVKFCFYLPIGLNKIVWSFYCF